MLDGLDDIDWHRLKHAYGCADDVPGLLRSLRSPDENTRREAIYDLFGNIYHQGTVYEATVYAAPFLTELLNADDTPCRTEVAFLLASIIDGRGYLEVHARHEPSESEWKSILAAQGRDLDTERTRELQITARVRQGAKACLPLLAPFLSHAESEIRASIPPALAAYPELAETHLPVLHRALATEHDTAVRQEIELAIERLRASQDSGAQQ